MRTNNEHRPGTAICEGLVANPDALASSFRSLHLIRLAAAALACVFLACSAGGGGQTAATGGMSGTGISQGSVTAFGSIFVNGIEWDLATASIEIEGTPALASDLRLGMVVRVEGQFLVTGTTGTATSVNFDDSVEGPIEQTPVDVIPGGLEKTFDILGTTILMHQVDTVFEAGAGFLTLAADDVVEISGFVDNNGAVQATRIVLMGQFPANSAAGLHDTVSGLIRNPGGGGSFMLGTILIHYTTATMFSNLTPATLANGNFVEATGILRSNGIELDADEIELETQGLGGGNASEAEIEGVVSNLVSGTLFDVAGTTVDATNSTFEPAGFMVMNGALLEVEGSLQNGVLIAERIQSEDENEALQDSHIEAAVTNVDVPSRTLTILGVRVVADGQTRIEDRRDGDPNFMFGEIQPGDWLDIRGIQTGTGTIQALRIERQADGPDVLLEGPVTTLDVTAPALTLIDQPIPLLMGTLYFNASSQSRTEDEFFRNPGDVMLGDVVGATDTSAVDSQILGEADEVELESN